jgi:hypothetical protein
MVNKDITEYFGKCVDQFGSRAKSVTPSGSKIEWIVKSIVTNKSSAGEVTTQLVAVNSFWDEFRFTLDEWNTLVRDGRMP